MIQSCFPFLLDIGPTAAGVSDFFVGQGGRSFGHKDADPKRERVEATAPKKQNADLSHQMVPTIKTLQYHAGRTR